MSESQDAIHIPLDIGTESVEEALREVEELDEKLQALKKHAAEAFTQATGLRLATQTAGNPITGAPGQPIDPMQTIKSALAGVQPAQYGSVISPQFAQAMQALQQRQQTIEAAFKLFQASPAFKPGAPSAVAQSFRDYAGMAAASASTKPTPVTMATETLNALGQVLGRALTAPALTGLFRASAASGLGSLGLGGPLGAGLLRGLGARGGPLAGVAAVGATAASVAGAISSNQAEFIRRQVLLQGATYDQGASPGTPQRSLEWLATQVAQGFNYDQGQANRSAVQLAMAGVPAGALAGGLSNTFALARLSGMSPDQVTPLTSALAVQGGFGPAQISAIFQELQNQVKLTGIPMARLIGDLKDLARETGNASVSVSGLTAVQQISGNAINAGQLLAPALGAGGAGALTAAGILGVTADQFMALQRNPAQMWDAMAKMVQQRTRPGAQGTLVAEQLLASSGLVDWTGIGPQQQARIITLLRLGKAGQAQRLAASIAAHTGNQQLPMTQWLGQTAQNTVDQTAWQDRAKIALENLITALLNGQILGRGGAPPVPVPDRTALRNPPGSPVRTSVRGLPAGQQYVVPNFAGSPNRLTPQLLQYYIDASNKTGVPLDYLLAQGSQESGFDPRAYNKQSGAEGIAQFLPSTAKQFNIDPWDPRQAIMAQAVYDKQLKAQYGTYQAGLNAYYGEDPYTGGYGPSVIRVALQLHGKLEVVDASGKIIGYVPIDQKTVPITHKPNQGRKPTGHSGWGPGRPGQH